MKFEDTWYGIYKNIREKKSEQNSKQNKKR